MPVTLPTAPDALGNMDGDYDLALAFRGADGTTAALAPVHPIHVETRDADGKVRGQYVPRVSDFLAANAGPARPSPSWLTESGVRHSRDWCPWYEFEPKDGVWDATAFGPDSRFSTLLRQARKYDMTVLPNLFGIPEWAQKRDAQGKPLGQWGPPADPARWAAYVDKVVGYYSKAPYYQQYWQIWNEAQPENGGFWSGGSWENFITQVYLPAAQAIRKHYVDKNGNGKEDPGERCLVVYGGFPCGHWQDGSYVKVLDIRQAGALTDILDVHYMCGFSWFQSKYSGNVYDKWVKPGIASGVWETEDGWGFAEDPVWFPKTSFGMVGWALDHQWEHANQFRFYFFHYYAPQPRYGFFSADRGRKWPNGYAVSTYTEVLRGDLALPGAGRAITLNGQPWPVLPKPEDLTRDVMRPLLAGGRLTLLFLAPDAAQAGAARFAVALKPDEQVKSVARVSVVKGTRTPVPFTAANGQLGFDINWTPGDKTEAGMESATAPECYLVIEGTRPFTVWP